MSALSHPSLAAEIERLRNLRNIAPPGPIQSFNINAPEEEDEGPKPWEFKGSVEELDMGSLIESLTQPPDEIDYSLPESIDNLNKLIKDYGDYLYQTKYSNL
jgi:hypothetical protein